MPKIVTKYAVQFSSEQERLARRVVGANRWLWNKLVEQAHRKGPSFKDEASKTLTELRNAPETRWLSELSRESQDFETQRLFAMLQRGERPRFVSKGQQVSFGVTSHLRIDALRGEVKLAGFGTVRFRNHRPLQGKPTSLRFIEQAGRWYLLVVESVPRTATPHPNLDKRIGVDFGAARLATLSNGEHFPSMRGAEAAERRLDVLKVRASRKQKGSRNAHKARMRVLRQQQRVTNIWRDALHKATALITRDFGTVIIEDLRETAATTTGPKGRSTVFGYRRFARYLREKLERRGGVLQRVDAHFTSQTCPECQHVSKANRRSQSLFRCTKCGFEAHADHSAARNIQARSPTKL